MGLHAHPRCPQEPGHRVLLRSLLHSLHSWSAHAPRCIWKSPRSGTSWLSCIVRDARAFASRRLMGYCGRGSQAWDAQMREATKW